MHQLFLGAIIASQAASVAASSDVHRLPEPLRDQLGDRAVAELNLCAADSGPAAETVGGDFTCEGALERIGQDGLGSLSAVESRDDYVYVAVGNTLLIYRTDGQTLEELGRVDAPGYIYDFGLGTNHAYLATGDHGLQMVDISDPSAPFWVGAAAYEGRPYDVVTQGPYAFVADREGFAVLVIARPTEPVTLARLPEVTHDDDVEVSDGFAYVADMVGSSVLSIDVSDPEHPAAMHNLSGVGSPIDLSIEGDLLGVAGGVRGFFTVDVQNPAAMRKLGQLPSRDECEKVTLVDGWAYLADDGGGFRILDLSNPSSPTEASSLSGVCSGVAPLTGGAIHLDTFSMRLVRISDPTDPLVVQTLDLGGTASDLVSDGDIACAVGWLGARVLDISGEEARELSFIRIDWKSPSAAISNGRLYVAAYINEVERLVVIDLSDPTAPVELGRTPVVDRWSIAASGDRVAVGGYGGEIQIVDVSDPTSPVVVAEDSLSAAVQDLAMSGDLVYVANNELGVRIFDISTPNQLREVGSHQPGEDRISALYLAGDRLYCAWGIRGLVVVDVSDPTNPVELGATGYAGGYSQGVAASGERATLAQSITYENGIITFDVSNPSALIEVGRCATPSWINHAVINHGGVDRILSSSGITAYRSNPVGIANETPSGNPNSARLLANRPNPFNPRTEVVFETVARGAAKLAIHDVAGRHVRTLLDQVISAGTHRIPWDGTGDTGRTLASGVYWTSLQCDGQEVRRAMIMLK